MMILSFILCGLIVGLIGGMLGIGGGVIIVPALYFLFNRAFVFEGHLMQVVVSTSLAISLIISLFSALVQHLKKALLFKTLKFLAPGLIVGSICGVILIRFISTFILKNIFGIVALLLGLYFMIPKVPNIKIAQHPNYTLSFFGMLIGALSSLLGIGGGIITFPLLLAYNLHAKQASATSSATTALTCLIGTLTFFVMALKNPPIAKTWGYIDIQAFIFITVFALITIPIGVKLSHTLKLILIRRVFGIFLCLVAVKMIFLNS